MRSEWKVTPDDAVRFLSGRFPDVRTVSTLQQGLWSSAYGFAANGKELVVRFSGIRDDFDKDARVAGLAGPEVPVPDTVEIGEALGGYYAIAPYLTGRPLDDLDDAGMRRVLPSLFAVLDGVRKIELGDTTGYGLWDRDGNGEQPSWSAALLDFRGDEPWRDQRWRERLKASRAAAVALEAGQRGIQELLIYCPEDRHLIHSDLLHWNVLVQDARVTGLLDWGSSMYGDFVYDVAWLTFWAPWYPRWSGIDFAHEARSHYAHISLTVPDLDMRLRCYELRIGVGALIWFASHADKGRDLERAALRIGQVT